MLLFFFNAFGPKGREKRGFETVTFTTLGGITAIRLPLRVEFPS